MNHETSTQRLDPLLHAGAAPFTRGLSPVSSALALADWAWHLAISPGRQMDFAALAAQLGWDTWRVATGGVDGHGTGEADEDQW